MYNPFKISDPRNLKISLAAPPNWTFAPGDNVIGTVVREASLVSPDATIRVSLGGIAETRMVEQYGNQQIDHSNRWDLLDPRDEDLFQGPLHLAEGSTECLTFPFEVNIPLRPSLTMIPRHNYETSFLPIDHDSVAEQTLPGTFACSNGDGSIGMIGYKLEAELRYRRGGEIITHTESCRLVIRHSLVEPPLVHYEMIPHSQTARMQSHRLVTGVGHLSLKKKIQNFYGSSSVPGWAYRVDISAPKAIQLDHSLPIPLTVNIVGVPDETSPALRDTTVTVIVQSIRISVISMTVTHVCGLGYSTGNLDFWRKTHSIVIPSRTFLTPIEFHVGQDSSPFDLGNVFQIYLDSDGLRKGTQRFDPSTPFSGSIYPDFVSYIIRHKHELRCELTLDISGESQTVAISAPLNVLPSD
ncbi:uncharacterized protein KD926_005947 [Aspergillus affinis]|uniref:uncharacterized protein n=1 Tax=Aspergillus affinis TaxID=1070780 RepID=UPI0022FE7A7B|nr:uncharacterized protein KD926_005947 [Aspergillus affinis]KAI9046001.1 hypothetical protein KD926_005947 [Aspergillus affinis]